MSMSLEVYEAPGLPADWLNAWLAAIGVTVLLPDVKLSWTDEPVPTARFWMANSGDFVARLDATLPGTTWLEHTAIAPNPPSARRPMKRNVDLATYVDRVRMARSTNDPLLPAAVTDLVELDRGGNVASGPLNPPVPKGITLAQRARACADAVESQGLTVRDTLGGTVRRRKGNGLGFDPRRLSGGAENPDNFTDPLLELLVLSAYELFPLRGSGQISPRQRGWTGPPGVRGAFRWATWHEPLDRWGIDALLDMPSLWPGPQWSSVPFRPSNANDPTRAYFSEPVQ